jgi:hypothetical protein
MISKMKTTKLFLALIMAMCMFATNASADKDKTTNLLIGFTPMAAKTMTSIKYNAKGAPKDEFTYNKEFGITIGIERVINGMIVLPELRYFRGSFKKASLPSLGYAMPYPFPYTEYDDLNDFGFMQWLGVTIGAKKRVQVPLMVGIGLDYLKGAPMNNLFFNYGAKARVKIYFTNKVGMFLGGAYEGGMSHSNRGIPSGADSDDKFNLKRKVPYGEVGLTVTL